MGTVHSFCITASVEHSLTSDGFSVPIQMSSHQFIFQGIIQSSCFSSCLLYQVPVLMTDVCINIVNGTSLGLIKFLALGHIKSLCNSTLENLWRECMTVCSVHNEQDLPMT